jgi:hypothetical protein
VEVHVAHHRAGRHAGPRRGARRLHQAAHVHRVGGHHQLTAVALPGVAWTIRIHLDAEAIGIGQVERLAHQVIARAGPHADLPEMADEPPERLARRQQDREVEEPVVRRGVGTACALPLDEFDERAPIPV